MKKYNRGTSLIDLLISMAIVALLFGGVYLVYFSIITALANVNVRTAASTAIANEMETIRNLPYDSVGTTSGIPAGMIPGSQSVVVAGYTFTLTTTVRNIDDPYDGTLGGNPDDLAPADYKLVQVDATCPLCENPITVEVTATVAPKALESATQNGSLFIYALDANGDGVQGATVNVVNASVTPSINLTDTTNASGVLELVGVPTSTQGYHIVVTKPGYSSDQTYPPGGAGNPNPTKPDATIATQAVTSLSFSIDRSSSLAVSASDDRCNAIADRAFSISGSKIIGTSPDVLKFATTTTVGASGTVTMQNVEWDTYMLSLSDATYDPAGTIPLDPLIVNPSSTAHFRFVLRPAKDPALLATVTDAATGAGILGANVKISQPGFSTSLLTGHSTVSETGWSDGRFSSQSGGIDTSVAGWLSLLANASGTYDTGVQSWLTSDTIDLGGPNATLYGISWNPVSQPPSTGAGSVQFQIAANNDNTTWNFVGPDGTAGSFFNGSSSIPAALSGKRYLRYKVYLETQDPATSPSIADVSFDFTADCVPPAQALFTTLPVGTYAIDVTATGYYENSSTAIVGSGFQSSTIQLSHE